MLRVILLVSETKQLELEMIDLVKDTKSCRFGNLLTHSSYC